MSESDFCENSDNRHHYPPPPDLAHLFYMVKARWARMEWGGDCVAELEKIDQCTLFIWNQCNRYWVHTDLLVLEAGYEMNE